DPVSQLLLLVGLYGIKPADLKTFTLRCSDSLSGVAAARKRISRFPNLREARGDSRSFCHPHLVEAMGLTGMLSIPVLNTANPNQVLLVVNLFAAGGALPAPESESHLYSLAARLAAAVEACLRERCIRYANRLPIALGRVRKWSQD